MYYKHIHTYVFFWPPPDLEPIPVETQCRREVFDGKKEMEMVI